MIKRIMPELESPMSAPSGPKLANRKVQEEESSPHPVFRIVEEFSYFLSFV